MLEKPKSYMVIHLGRSAFRNVGHFLYSCIGTEGRQVLNKKELHAEIKELKTNGLWEIIERSFIRPRKATFDRNIFFARKQRTGDTVEQYYSKKNSYRTATGLRKPQKHSSTRMAWYAQKIPVTYL